MLFFVLASGAAFGVVACLAAVVVSVVIVLVVVEAAAAAAASTVWVPLAVNFDSLTLHLINFVQGSFLLNN